MVDKCFIFNSVKEVGNALLQCCQIVELSILGDFTSVLAEFMSFVIDHRLLKWRRGMIPLII